MRAFAVLVLLWLQGAAAGEVVIDAATGAVVAGDQIEAPRFPASVTKLMTIQVALDAVKAGEIELSSKLIVSPRAASAPPVKLGLRAGETITLAEAIHAALTLSSNDAARVIAEAVSGSEADFAARMTRRGREIGLTATRFRNASGLPDPDHVSTALDMARLAAAVDRSFGAYLRPLFRQPFTRGCRSRGPRNGAVARPAGARLGKTGFTCAAGYTAALLVETPDGPRAIATTANAGKSDRAASLARLSRGEAAARPARRACAGATTTRQASRPPPALANWALTLGVFPDPDAARLKAAHGRATLGAAGFVVGRRRAGAGYYALLLASDAAQAEARRKRLAASGIEARVIDQTGLRLLGLTVMR